VGQVGIGNFGNPSRKVRDESCLPEHVNLCGKNKKKKVKQDERNRAAGGRVNGGDRKGLNGRRPGLSKVECSNGPEGRRKDQRRGASTWETSKDHFIDSKAGLWRGDQE